MSSFDVAVVGGGVVGSAVALEAARRGARVALVADDRPGASMAAAGMLCPSFEALHFGGAALLRLGTQSLALWDDFAASLADDPASALDYARDGVIGVAFAPRALPGDAVSVPEGIEAGSAVEVRGEGQIDPRRLLPALRRAADALGVTRVPARAEGLFEEEGRVVGVRLPGADAIRAGVVVLATGAAASDEADIVPIRGRAFAVADAPAMPSRIVRSPSVYLCPKSDGTLYVGATEEERDMPSAPDAVWHEACWLMPSLRHARIVGRFDGVRPGTRNGLPVVGRSARRQGLVLALGHHRNGVLLAPLTARRVADACGL